jgi:hypothetical protein
MNYKTCTYIHDTGYLCQSAAVGGREYCCYHLRHLGRQMRMAKQRASCERFDLHLPPLENMHAVQSALSQVIEALAADMIDPKRAHELLLALRQAATNFRHPEAWRASEYKNDQSAAYPASYEEFEAEYGLPENLDLHVPPEVAFPPPTEPVGAPSLSPSFGDRVGDADGAGVFDGIPMPTVDYCKHGPGCPEHTIRVDYPETPELAELREIKATQGMEAVAERHKQQQHNRHRRHVLTDRKRYAAIALEKNIRLAAERLAAQKLAADKTGAQEEAAQKAQPDPAETKKPTARAVPESAPATQTEAKKTA